ncbi:hypothetical protein [Fodinibius halophilus]|uniref:DUF2784 domain-containing protein n=1 Tax=Fodinibius halophilus TaxID=1736908 RepID=A0A6M1T0D9_9BACT|nr:hypothetical protein [Fodinibius halophilus]NGP87447.1 hypothetical protein [Fodinibius halophilus]
MSKTVFYIKFIHSLLFFLIGISTIYVLITAILDHITVLTWIAFGIAVIELLALMLNNWRCPLTVFAEDQGAEVGSVADIFLPDWLADHIFPIFGILFTASCILLLWRLLA